MHPWLSPSYRSGVVIYATQTVSLQTGATTDPGSAHGPRTTSLRYIDENDAVTLLVT
jgi:hypothetical protein